MSPFVIEKMCNALVPDAQVALGGLYSIAEALDAAPSKESMNATLERFRSWYGGLWVGGTVRLTLTNLSFMPNALNRAVHKGDYSLSIPLSEIAGVTREFGFVTGIVRLATVHGVVKLRCFGAKNFVALIQAHITTQSRPSLPPTDGASGEA